MKQNKNRHMSAILMPLVFSVCFLVSLLCLSDNTSAVSLTISMSDSSAVSLDVLGTQEGSFSKSASRSFSVSTDNITGYTLSIRSNTASGNDGSGVLLYNGNDDTYVINSIGSENNFPTNGISENIYRNGDGNNNTYTNTWGYKPSMINSSNNSNFLPAPDTAGDTLNITNCANGTENTTCINASDTYSIILGAKVDSTVRIGSYSNTFVILAVANAIPYSIIYNDNVVTSMPVDINSNSTGNSVTISSTVPVRDGYSFLGWCATTPTTTNGTDSCSGTVYNPNGNGTNLEYPLDRTGGSNNINLYAMWSGSGGSGSFVPVTVNFAGDGADKILSVIFASTGVTFDDVVTVKADGTVVQLASGVEYTITGTYKRASFGNWATVGGTIGSTSSASTTFTVTSASTLTLTAVSWLVFQNTTSADCGAIMYDNRGTEEYKDIGYTTAMVNSLCWMTRNLDLPGGTVLSQSDSNLNGSKTSYTLPASSTANFNSSVYVQLVYNSGSTSCENSTPCYSYYTYPAATAGTNPSSGDATSDICPKGWRLPTRSEYVALKNTYSTPAAITGSPWFGVYAGDCADSGCRGMVKGFYWSSSTSDSSIAPYISFDSSNVEMSSSRKGYGNSLRCVAKE